jgi:peroxiredoxin
VLQSDLLPTKTIAVQYDGTCDHLLNLKLPSIKLPTTGNSIIDFSSLNSVVIYCYPMTSRPDSKTPDDWDKIPGARGCTPQSCAFRDHYNELKELGSNVFGLSTQSTEYQLEAKTRLHLPFELVSDRDLRFIDSVNLPTFSVEGQTLVKRVTLIVQNRIIKKVFYPIPSPDKNAEQVIEFLHDQKA